MKKIISVLLSVLLIFGTFGAVLASASTEAAAKAAADEFNAAKNDYSDELGNFRAEDVEKLIAALDAKAAELLKVKLLDNLYTDETAVALIKLINGKLGVSYSDIDTSVLKKSFPEAYKYIMQAKKDKVKVADWETVPFGIENEEEFVLAVSATLNGAGSLVGLICLTNQSMYLDYLLPFVESLHLGALPTHASDFNRGQVSKGDIVDMVVTDVTNNGVQIGTATLKVLLPYLLQIKAKLEAAPVSYVLDVLPDVLTHYDAFATAFASLNLPTADELVASLLAKVEGVNWPERDLAKLMNMATAAVAESGAKDGYTMQLNGDKPVVFSSLINYLGETLKDQENALALGKLVVTKLGVKEETYNALAEALRTKRPAAIAANLCNVLDELIELNKPADNAFVSGFMTFIQKVLKMYAKIFEFLSNLFKS